MDEDLPRHDLRLERRSRRFGKSASNAGDEHDSIQKSQFEPAKIVRTQKREGAATEDQPGQGDSQNRAAVVPIGEVPAVKRERQRGNRLDQAEDAERQRSVRERVD